MLISASQVLNVMHSGDKILVYNIKTCNWFGGFSKIYFRDFSDPKKLPRNPYS